MITSKTFSGNSVTSNSSKWFATPKRLVLVNVLIELAANERCFKLFSECIAIGTVVKSLSVRSNVCKELRFDDISGGKEDSELCASDNEMRPFSGNTGSCKNKYLMCIPIFTKLHKTL